MNARRRLLAMACAAALALLTILLLSNGEPGFDVEGGREAGGHDPVTAAPGGAVLQGRRLEAPIPAQTEADQAQGDRGASVTGYEVEVLDYRGAPVEHVVVYLERDWNDYSSGTQVRGWRTLDDGTTNEAGRVTLDAVPPRREDLNDGYNHRLRLEPPGDREDLGATWMLWRPEPQVTYRFSRMHVLRGTVLDGGGQPVAGATVFIGNPAWRETVTGPQGQFAFKDIPSTSGGMVDVWAIRPGVAPPASSKDVKHAVAVGLDERSLEIRIE